jgi:hypothetical protein
MTEVRVRVLEVESDRGRRLRRSTADLRELELDPVREVDADAMFRPRREASDRTSPSLERVPDTIRAVRRSTFTSNSMGLNSGGWTVRDIIR